MRSNGDARIAPRRVRPAGEQRPALPLWDVNTVAEMLGVQVRHVRRLVSERRIPFIKWGHLLRFDPTEIEQWLDQLRVPEIDEFRPPLPPQTGRSRTGR